MAEVVEMDNVLKKEQPDLKIEGLSQEIKSYRNERRQDRRDMNKHWGYLADKRGTVVVDIVEPAIVPIIEKYFEHEILTRMTYCQKRNLKTGQKGEFDVVVVTETHVFLVETKTSPDKAKMLNFKERTVPKFREFFPEYENLALVPIFSSLSFEPELVETATEEGVYLLAYRKWEYMDILNFEAIAGSSPDNAEPQ